MGSRWTKVEVLAHHTFGLKDVAVEVRDSVGESSGLVVILQCNDYFGDFLGILLENGVIEGQLLVSALEVLNKFAVFLVDLSLHAGGHGVVSLNGW